MEDHIPIPVYVNDFWAIFNLAEGWHIQYLIVVLYDKNACLQFL